MLLGSFEESETFAHDEQEAGTTMLWTRYVSAPTAALALFTILSGSNACAPPEAPDFEPSIGLPPRLDSPASPAADNNNNNSNAPPAPTPAMYGLIDVRSEESARITSLTANAGFKTVHELDVNVEPGDVLRVFGQVEVTNDFAQPVNVTLRARVDDEAVGNTPTENAVATASHHMPLWIDASVIATTSTRRTISLQVAATRTSANPSVIVENGFGHLTVEHYRSFPSRAALEAADARGVVAIGTDHKARVTAYGGSFATRTLPFAVTTNVRAGDVIRVFGTSTSRTPTAEMHGLGIFRGDTHLGPWATKNGGPESLEVPLTSDAIDRPLADGVRSYSVSMHGVFNHGGMVVSNAGGLDVLVFRSAPISVSADASAPALPIRAPKAFLTEQGAAMDVVANQPAKESAVVKLGKLEADTPVRIAAHVVAVPKAPFTQSIVCTLRAVLTNGGVDVVAPVVSQSITPAMASAALALRSVLVVPPKGAGEAAVRASVACTRTGGANPTIALLPTSVTVEPFTF